MDEQPWSAKYFGRVISYVKVHTEGERVEIALEGGPTLFIWDDGQSCCESRYITCDDDLQRLAGGVLMAVVSKSGPTTDVPEEYNVHETGFVDIITSNGTAVLCTHNEHNGYYGGFSLKIAEGKWPDGNAAYLQHEEN